MIDYGLKDKVVLVTGTNNPLGIGAKTALAFAGAGAKLALVYKKMQFSYDENKIATPGPDSYHKALSGDCETLEGKLNELGSRYLVMEGDIRDEAFVSSCFDQVETKFGKVQILVNNAATYAQKDTIFTLSTQDMHDVYDTNVKGTLLMMREFVSRFSQKSHGRVINLSTDAAQVFAGGIAYGSSKAALEALTRAIAIEVGGLGITVNTVAPGPTQTGWIDEDLSASVLPQIPIPRLGLPEDIADLILFLASDKAGWLTGQVIKVSGGHAL